MLKTILKNLVKNFDKREAEIIAWAVAAEGSITLDTYYRHERSNEVQIRPSIQISNTELQFVTKLRKMCGGSIYLDKRKTRGWKNAYRLHIMGRKEILEFLVKTYPFLPIKRKQAKIVIAFCKSRLKKRRKAPYSKYELSLAEKIHILNRRGIKNDKKT